MIFNIFIILHFILMGQIKSFETELIRGVNLGGWLVLEPWITPSLFYVSFGLQDKFPIDMYTFCDYYSPDIANIILSRHWNNWVLEEDIKYLSEIGINTLRIPIGDWMYMPYGPFNKFASSTNKIKCADGSIARVDWIFEIAQKYNLKIILDLHGIKGSQNGFDNSGQSANIKIDSGKYEHWNIRAANWIGEFDTVTKQYKSIDYDNIQYSLNLLEHLFKIYSDKTKYSNLYGFNILNEPWEFIPEFILKKFYQDSFNLFVKYMDSDIAFIFHDSFRPQLWTNFILTNNYKRHPIYIDTHHYTAWANSFNSFFAYTDSNKKYQVLQSIYPYIIGEFSLAIDNCEMWLNGFMDNIEGYPKYECKYKKCPNTDIYLNKLLIYNSIYGPEGTGISRPNAITCECPTTINLSTHFNQNNPNLKDLETFDNFDTMEETEFAKLAFESKIKAYENIKSRIVGWMFWNFKIESRNYQWDFLQFANMTKIQFNNKIKYSNTNKNNLTNNKLMYKIFVGLSSFICITLFCYIVILIVDCMRMKNKYIVYEEIDIELSTKSFNNSKNIKNYKTIPINITKNNY
jgi:glucan 1,3-beta-glucosidase